MKNNNLWNNIFHKKEINKNKEQVSLYIKQLHNAPKILENIEVATSLKQLLNIHKDAWGSGFQNINLSSDKTGMFRCDSILTMTPDQVYLGGIYGLNTESIIFWENHKCDKYDVNNFGISADTMLYDIVLTQYKILLRTNIKKLYDLADKNLQYYRKNGY